MRSSPFATVAKSMLIIAMAGTLLRVASRPAHKTLYMSYPEWPGAAWATERNFVNGCGTAADNRGKPVSQRRRDAVSWARPVHVAACR
jgi:hypothetical protein